MGRVGAARVLVAVGGVRDPFTTKVAVPCVRTLGRVLAKVDPNALQGAADALTATLIVRPLGGLRAMSVDGKTARGARRGGTYPPHLVAVLTHATPTSDPVLLTQSAVGAKTGEAPAARALGVPGHYVGGRRLAGGSPPSALWRRRVL